MANSQVFLLLYLVFLFRLLLLFIQIRIMSEAVFICIPIINSFFITMPATGIIIFHSIFGGIRVITITDV